MKLSHKLIKSLSLGIVSLGLLAGIGMTSNSSSNVHADALDDDLNQGIAETEASDKNFNRNAENGYIQTTLSLKNDKDYPQDVVETLINYPNLEHSAVMNKMISYLSPKGREQFNKYYFYNSSTGVGLDLKESSDAAAGLDYDPHNSADNYLPLAHQHYISTAQEKKLQNPPLFPSDNTSKSKKHHVKKVTKHHYNKKHIKATKLHRTKKHGKKITRTRAKRTRNRRARKISSKKQVNKLNKQLKADKKALKSRKAKHNTKYRKTLTRTIKKISRQLKSVRK